jgi:3-hydroxyacyl-[acyl-carrier-protein] dehydratase
VDDKAPASGPKSFDTKQIMDLIPHRPPFLMIDRVTDVTPGTSAVGIKDVRPDDDYFKGHFPGHPIMPGVLIIEAMAQTAAVLVVETMGKETGNLVYFMSVDHARFRKPVFPGDELLLHVEALQSRGRVWKFKGEARVGGELKAEAVYSAMIVKEK